MRALHPSVAEGTQPVTVAFSVLRPSIESLSWLRWAIPDLAMVAALATVFYVFVLFGGATSLFRDSDAGWHIRNGERMLSTGAFAATDIYSFSKAGQPWVSWEWLSDLASGAVHRSFGLGGVAVLYAGGIGACVWLWVQLNWRAGGSFWLACLLAIPLLSTTDLHWLARPHIFGWLFLLITVWFCEALPEHLTPAVLICVAAFSALWANMHGSFFLGSAVALVYAAGHGVHGLIWNDRRANRSWSYLALACVALGGSLLNPYGWNLHRHVFSYLADGELLSRVGEFQTFNFHADGAIQIIFGLGIGFAGGFAALAAHRPERFLLSMLFSLMALQTARALPIAALILLPLANGSITELLRNVDIRFRRKLDGVLQHGDQLRRIDSRFSGFGWAPLCAALLFMWAPHMHAGFPKDQFPVTAAESVAQLPASARLFAPDKFGGYLIYRFAGNRKVFFDGRSDFYGAAFLKTYGRMVQVRPGWQTEWARWNFSHALLPVDYSLVPALESLGWTTVYRDRTAVLLESPRT